MWVLQNCWPNERWPMDTQVWSSGPGRKGFIVCDGVWWTLCTLSSSPLRGTEWQPSTCLHSKATFSEPLPLVVEATIVSCLVCDRQIYHCSTDTGCASSPPTSSVLALLNPSFIHDIRAVAGHKGTVIWKEFGPMQSYMEPELVAKQHWSCGARFMRRNKLHQDVCLLIGWVPAAHWYPTNTMN